MSQQRITVAYGDGIGPEIMKATLRILEAANADLAYDVIEIGEKQYLKGEKTGIAPEAWTHLRNNKVFLKAPITTPQGGGYKSLNVSIRKSLGLFANVRPVVSYSPYVNTHFPKMDLVIVRENEEDLYAGIEHQQTNEVVQTLKLISRQGSESIIRYAFEYARVYGRKKVTCMSKDNIMKQTDGEFHRIFDRVAKEYTGIEAEHMIIDIGSAVLAADPERFEVIVTLNLYGDIISDIAAQVGGSVGLGGSANVGQECAMFEAIHGSAPDIAGKGIANPSGLLNGAIMMLAHLGQGAVAEKIGNAWLKTLVDGIHTGDIYNEAHSTKRVGTQDFATAVIERLGERPQRLKPLDLGNIEPINIKHRSVPPRNKELVGIDVFIDWTSDDRNPQEIGKGLEAACSNGLKLKMITNRGVQVYPRGYPETHKTDHWRCRFVNSGFDGSSDKYPGVEKDSVLKLLNTLSEAGWDVIKTENLYFFDGTKGFSEAH